MPDEDIRTRLKEQMASIHAPDEVCCRTLRKIEGKEEITVRKKLLLSPVLGIILLTVFVCTALAAAGFLWGHPLDETLNLNVSNTVGVVSYPNLAVKQGGVTIHLDQCAVDEHTAYIAFVISGYQLPQGRIPGFHSAEAVISLEPGHGKAGHFMAYSADGVTDTYMDDNGNLVYLFLISSPNESLLGRDVHIEFADLCAWDDDGTEVPETTVHGQWTFDWTFTGVIHSAVYDGLSVPISESGWILTGACITPVTAIVTIDCPQVSDNSCSATEPLFVGIVHTDGQKELLAGLLGGTDHSLEHKQYVTLNRVIDVNSLKSLIFAVPGMDEPVCVELPEQTSLNIQ